MEGKFNEVFEQFELSLNDYILSRSEKRQLKLEIKDLKLNPSEAQVLKSELKKMAIQKISGNGNQLIIEWMYEANKLLSAQSDQKKTDIPRVIFSPGEECREAIISQIRFAKQKIRICVFTISDNRISEEIIQAHKLGKKVQILTDNEKQFDMGSDIEQFRQEGIPVVIDQTKAHMHHKFALIDSDTVITGSYNWTRSAATSNHENILITRDISVFKAYEKEFEGLWKEMS